MQKKDKFQLKLQNRFEKLSSEEDTEEMAEIITEAIQECALETEGKDTRSRKEKLKLKTKELLKKRREMADKDQTATEKIEYSKLCKTIGKMRGHQRTQHHESQEAIESGKGLKKATKRREGHKVHIPALKEQDGTITTNRERILERSAVLQEPLQRRSPKDHSLRGGGSSSNSKQRDRARNKKHEEQ